MDTLALDVLQPILASRPAGSSIRVVTTAAERRAVARLRYEVYVEELGRVQPSADHVARELHEPLDEQGFIIADFDADGRAIATLRVNPTDAPALAFRELYGWDERERAHPGATCVASKLVVDRAHRGTSLSIKIMRVGTTEILRRGWRFAFLDANDHLVPLYTRMGFIARARRQHPLYGSVTIMEWDMHDVAHAQAIRSPMLREMLAFQQRLGRVA